MKRNVNLGTTTGKLTLYAVLTAVLIILALVNIPMPAGLSITFNMIPVAIAGIAMGPVGGLTMGTVFGLISFAQCWGILGFSGMGAALVSIEPVLRSVLLVFVQRVLSRMLMGWLTAMIYRAVKDRLNRFAGCAVAGFFSAFLNTLFFMSMLVLFFGGTEYMRTSMAGRGFFAYLIAAVGINGLVEMIAATLITGAVGTALGKARLL